MAFFSGATGPLFDINLFAAVFEGVSGTEASTTGTVNGQTVVVDATCGQGFCDLVFQVQNLQSAIVGTTLSATGRSSIESCAR